MLEVVILLKLAPKLGHSVPTDLSEENCRPTILVLAGVDPDTGKKRLNARWERAFMGHQCDFVEIDPTCIAREDLRHILGDVDGILLTGNDINVPPQYYGQEAHGLDQQRLWGGAVPDFPFYDERYQASRYITEYSKEHKIPLLAVCLGAQEVNVSMGGTLRQNIEGHFTDHSECDDRWDEAYHDILVREDGVLAKAFGQSGLVAQNSVHKQGMYPNDIAKGLQIEAIAEDGNVVEAFSLPEGEHPFFLGVQFHVESTKPYGGNCEVFSALINKSRLQMVRRLDAYSNFSDVQHEVYSR